MGDYDAFLVELLEYTKKQSLKELGYEELSRATNKVCKTIFGDKPKTDAAKAAQANMKRKVKAEWKKATEVEPGVIASTISEEKEGFGAEEEEEEQQAKEETKEVAKEEELVDGADSEFCGFPLHMNMLNSETKAELERLAFENNALLLANQKLAGLVDGLCIGSSVVLSGMLLMLLLYKLL